MTKLSGGGGSSSDRAGSCLVEGVAERLLGCTSSRCCWNIGILNFTQTGLVRNYYSWVVYRFVVFAESVAYVQDGVISMPTYMKHLWHVVEECYSTGVCRQIMYFNEARPSDRGRFLPIGKKASSYRGAYRVPIFN